MLLVAGSRRRGNIRLLYPSCQSAVKACKSEGEGLEEGSGSRVT